MSRLREKKNEVVAAPKVAECLARVAEADEAARRTVRPETQDAYRELARSWQQLATCWGTLDAWPRQRSEVETSEIETPPPMAST
jgi:hypothetical protein